MDQPGRRLPALARALSSPPAVPGVRDESELTGLARRSVRAVDLLGNSVAVVAPAASALVSPFLMLYVVGPGAWLSAVIGFALAFLLASVFSQYATRVAAAGSMYTWVTRTLGPAFGLLIAAAMVFGYGTLVAFGVSQSVRYTADASTVSGLTTFGTPTQLLLACAVTGVCVLASVRGIGVATRIAAVAEVLLVVGLVVLVVVTIERDGLALGSLLPLEGADPLRVLLGASFIMAITVGFESSAALAAEARRPFLGVPRSMTGTVAISAALYAIAYVAMHSIVVTEGTMTGPAGRWFPSEVNVDVADATLDAVLVLSYFALALCALNALTRVVFSLAREGLLPHWLGRTHSRWLSPYGALVAVAPFAVLPAFAAAALGQPIGSLAGRLLGGAVLILAVAYVVVALSVPVFLARLNELTWLPVAAALSAAVLTATVAGLRVKDDLERGLWLASALTAASLLSAVAWYAWLRVRRPATLRQMGIHDETITADLLGR